MSDPDRARLASQLSAHHLTPPSHSSPGPGPSDLVTRRGSVSGRSPGNFNIKYSLYHYHVKDTIHIHF